MRQPKDNELEINTHDTVDSYNLTENDASKAAFSYPLNVDRQVTVHT